MASLKIKSSQLLFAYLIILKHSISFVCSVSFVMDLSTSEFEPQLQHIPAVLIKFYAPWCTHSQQLAPEYEKAAKELQKISQDARLARIDCTIYPIACHKLDISTYPTLKLFKYGILSDNYSGIRKSGAIIDFMKAYVSPEVQQFHNEDEFYRLWNKNSVVLVGFFTELNSQLMTAFKHAAKQLNKDFKFMYTSDSNTMTKFGYTDSVVLFRPTYLENRFENGTLQSTGIAQPMKLMQWIEDNAMGLVGYRTPSTIKYFEKMPLFVAYFNVDFTNEPKKMHYIRNRLLLVAKKYKDAGTSAFFAFSSSREMSYDLRTFGFTSVKTSEVYVTAVDQWNVKYRMEDEFSTEALDAFVGRVVAGTAVRYRKSAAPPLSNERAIKIVVGSTFDDIVMDVSKDVLVMFHIPRSEVCERFERRMEEVRSFLKDEKDLVFAKMDVTENDPSAPYEVEGFPTIYFAGKWSKKRPVVYRGLFETESLLEFVAQKASFSLKNYDRNGKKKKEKKNEKEKGKTEL